ncbi:hypothetical protein CHS0354_014865 [Potamilus streckersoni]|uniref:Mitochondrial fission factor n=1 Tax=Potamilus streckersoni TaxID=2493646 RepID=A0AAE0RLZ6_9BIVA|nr:hypothetical protein CHS0354_014865 [Potamilus streckersoni]
MEDMKSTPTKIRVQSLPSDYSDIQPKTYDPEFISHISNKMQVPDKIEAVDVSSVEFVLRQRTAEPQPYNMMVPDRIFIANDGSHVAARQEMKHFDFEQFPQSTGSNYVGLTTPPRTLTLEERFPLVEDKENPETVQTSVQRPVANGIIPYPEPYTPGISTANTLLLNEEDEATQIRTQVAKLIRRVTVMEQENQKRSQREVVMYTVMFGYLLVKLFSYLFKNK